jgi:hypothetical protein
MKTIITYLFGPVAKGCHAQRWFSLAILAAVLLGSSLSARAQSVEESLQLIKDAIDALNIPTEGALLMKIEIIEDMLAQGRVQSAINQLNALAARLDAAGNGTLEEKFDDIVTSIDEVVADILSPPMFVWYIDQDGDNYTVEVGTFDTAPVAPYLDTPGNGPDCDDNDPTNRCPVCSDGGQMWYVDMDHDGIYAVWGCDDSLPIAGAITDYHDWLDCDDNNPEQVCEPIPPL